MSRRLKLTREQIEAVCRELLHVRRLVTFREARTALKERYGATARSDRVCKILREMASKAPTAQIGSEADISLIERLERAEKRAALAEEREERNQETIARRVDERLKAMEDRYVSEVEALRRRPTMDQYLRARQDLAAALRMIAGYESGDVPLPKRG